MKLFKQVLTIVVIAFLSTGAACDPDAELMDSPNGAATQNGHSTGVPDTGKADDPNRPTNGNNPNGDGTTDGTGTDDGTGADDGTQDDPNAPALTVRLEWTHTVDLDLHVKNASGEEIYYRNRESADGGRFTKDGCLATRCDGTEAAIEEVQWQRRAPGGTYEVWAVNYDGTEAVNFKITIEGKGISESFNGTVGASEGAKSDVFAFQIEGRNCDGSPAADGSECIGQYKGTYYYVSNEADYSGADNTTLYDAQCRAIAQVPASFSDSACIEGTGRLEDGRIVNYAKTCSCGRSCPTGGTICYSVLGDSHPWGKGVQNIPLVPLRSWAVDRDNIAIGTKVYVPEWDGVQIPSISGIGGFTHDGCFKAVDVGGAIKGKRFDFFAGTPAMWRALERIVPSMTAVEVYINDPKCSGL